MKKTSILTSAVLAAVLTAGLQANATTTTTWASATVTLHTPAEIETPNYASEYIPFSSLLVGGVAGTAYNGQTITTGILSLDIGNDTTHAVSAWLGGLGGIALTAVGNDYLPNSQGWVYYNINTSTELSYIETHSSTGIEFTAQADCYLDAYNLSVTGTSSGVPDGGSTMVLLGGVLTTLGLIKRKMA